MQVHDNWEEWCAVLITHYKKQTLQKVHEGKDIGVIIVD